MKIVKEYPPNFNEICQAFPFVRSNALWISFAYGDTLYNPGGSPCAPHLMVHEETHQRQQGDDPAGWWVLYLKDPAFRLNMEVEAYGRQYKYVCEHETRPVRRNFLKAIAKDLSGPTYGNLLPFERAKELIDYASRND